MLLWYFWKNKLKPNLSAVWTVKICINKRCFLMSLSYSVQILEAELRITFNMSMSPTHAAYISDSFPQSVLMTLLPWQYSISENIQHNEQIKNTTLQFLFCRSFRPHAAGLRRERNLEEHAQTTPSPSLQKIFFPIPGCQRRASWLIPATAPLLRTVILHIMGIPEWFLQSCYREDAASVLRWKSWKLALLYSTGTIHYTAL